MLRSSNWNILAELEEAHWGLLPTLVSLPLLYGGAVSFGWAKGWALAMASLMACYDIAVRRIPNPLTASTALVGLAFAFISGGLSGLGQAALGGLIGLGLMVVFFLFGAVGGGDVKAIAALGTLVGPWGAVELFVFTTLAGGVLALLRVALARRTLKQGGVAGFLQQSRGLKLPYGIAIWAGCLVVVLGRSV